MSDEYEEYIKNVPSVALNKENLPNIGMCAIMADRDEILCIEFSHDGSIIACGT